MTTLLDPAVRLAYPVANIAALIAAMVLLYRMRLGAVWVAAPILAVCVLTLVLQFVASSMINAPLFAFGIIAGFRPALAIVPPVFLVYAALSARWSAKEDQASDKVS